MEAYAILRKLGGQWKVGCYHDTIEGNMGANECLKDFWATTNPEAVVVHADTINVTLLILNRVDGDA
jgi:hypothetical protein